MAAADPTAHSGSDPEAGVGIDAEVIVVGGGPVGMTVALDLARRGVDVLVLERSRTTTDNPRCNTTNARSMEYFRRLGIADDIRRAGLPLEHTTDVVYTTNLLGYELARFPFSSSAAVLDRSAPEFEEWATPEPQHRVSQIYLEPIIERAVAGQPTARVLRGLRVESVAQSADGVTVTAVPDDGDDAAAGRATFRAAFVVGCDGGASVVRKSIGAALEGDARVAERRLSVYFRSSEMHGLLGDRPGWMYWWYGPVWRGSFVQLDGRELYLCHGRVPDGVDPDDVDPDEVLEAAIGRPVEHETIQVVRWDPRRLVADRFRDGRVLLAGDAAHLWLPLGGFGMNTGIADAVGLAWRVAANVQGWGGERLLDDYARERRSVSEATSRAALQIDSDMRSIGRDPDLHADSDRGAELRRVAGGLIETTDKKQWYSQGVQFGARYVDSPGIAARHHGADAGDVYAEGGSGGAIAGIDVYEPSVAPGARLPHYWRPDGTSVFDALGPAWTLLRVGAEAPVGDAFAAAAQTVGAPLTVLDLPEAAAGVAYEKPLVLCRPDLFVAWSGDRVPDDAAALVSGLLARTDS